MTASAAMRAATPDGFRASTDGADGLPRLTPFECMYLQLDRPDWPCHFGGLAIMEGAPLLDEAGRLRIDEIRRRIDLRVARVPRLRQRIHRPRWFLGPPLWVDDAAFDIERHVHEASVPAPGADAEVLDTAARLYGGLLDRRHPLWELWLMTGLADGRVAALLKLHHAVADGMAAVAVMGSLFDTEPLARDPPLLEWSPRPVPERRVLFRDNMSGVLRKLRGTTSTLVRPARLLNAVRTFAKVVGRSLGRQGAPRTSLNGPVRAGRRVSVLRIERAAMKRVARSRQATVNDLVLTIWTGGLRRLLQSRGEPVAHLELAAGQAVSLRPARHAGRVDNQVGTVLVPLPAWEGDPNRRLALIRAMTRTRRARRQFPAAIAGIMAAMARTPLGTWLNHHQRAANVIVTNVPGSPVPVYVLGARVIEILPVIQLVGNIGLTLCAFTYAGSIAMVVTADARGFPDLEQAMAGMTDDWASLSREAKAGHDLPRSHLQPLGAPV